jgi:acetyl-CoA carboxylase carboxyl transferase subunit beta
VDIAVVAASRLSATGELEAPGPPRAELVLGVLWLARGGAIVRGPLRPSAVRADRVFTELGVLDVTQDGLVLIELAAGVSAADFQRQAEPTLLVSPRISEMKLRADSLDDGRTEQYLRRCMGWPEKTAPTTDASEKRTLGEGVFRLCEGCGITLETEDLALAFEVCPSCGHHHKLTADGWKRLLLDGGELDVWDGGLMPSDPLEFSDGVRYAERLAASRKKTGYTEAVDIGRARIGGVPVGFGCFLFGFMGGSMGSVVGEKVTRLFERALAEQLPVVLLQASGGARMQEGILSLMQMAKSVAALERFREQGLPFLSVLLHPTTGGVAASFAFLGDVNIAEPGALIGFAGPRVIENTIRQKLPEGFQRAEFLLDHGMVDMVVPRTEMKERMRMLLLHLRTPR